MLKIKSIFSRKSLHIVVAASVLSSLTACVPLILAGAVTGSMAALDRRSTGIQVEDQQIEFRAKNALAAAHKDENININSYNRIVLLTGEVSSANSGKLAAATVRKMENVADVVNELGVGANSSLSARTSDATITTKVKTALIGDKLVNSQAHSVTTERGVVYLQGRVTQSEGARVAEIAQGVSGVQKIVKVYEYISDAEYSRLQTQTAPSQAASPAK